MKIKTFSKITASLALLVSLTGCFGGNRSEEAIAKYGSDTLKVFNCGEYIDPLLVSEFESQFGVRVIYETYLSNEEMYTKVSAGDSYDVLVPSDYMIERMMHEDMLQKLDLSLIPNLENLADQVKNLPFDPANTYSVPYFWGSVGIVYNKNEVPEKLLEKEGFSIMQNTDYKGRIYMYDSERDSFMIALKDLGYSMNTSNEDEIMEAFDWLVQINKTMEPAYVTDEVIDYMATGVKDLAIVYSGDAAYILSENEDMGYFCPEYGTNLWTDAMVIPNNAKNPLLAHEFINFMLEYDIAYDNSAYVGYASVHKEVLEDMIAPGGDFEDNPAYLPRSGNDKDEYFVFNRELMAQLSELWIKAKIQK